MICYIPLKWTLSLQYFCFTNLHFHAFAGCSIISEESGVRSQGKNPEQIPGNLYNSALYKHVSLSSPKVVQRERNPKNTYNTHLRSGL